MFRLFSSSLLILALGTAVMSGPAMADDPSLEPYWGIERMMGGDWGAGGAMGWWRPDGMLDRLDGRLAYMKAELKITSEQASAWNEFEATVKSSAIDHNSMMLSMRDAFKAGRLLDRPLPDRLSWHIGQLETRLTQMRSVKTAVDKLYGVLTPEQKLVVDDVFPPMMGLGVGRSEHMMRW